MARITPIRHAIQTSPKSRYRLARETGIDQSQLAKLLKGQRGLSLESMERLAEALGLQIMLIEKKQER